MNPSTTPNSIESLGIFGRLGRWSAQHRRTVFLGWATLIIALGAVAPRVEHALSGGGWQADGSQSVAARALIERHFDGQGSYALAVVVSSARHTAGDPAFRHAVQGAAQALRRDPAVAGVQLPRRGESVSPDGHVAVVRGGAGADTAEMVRAADRVQKRLQDVAPRGVQVALTGSAALWSQFNEENKSAMLRSEITSWPLTLAVLLIAFGSVAAAGIPLLLSILGLVAAAGALWVASRFTGITIWAMNFALMFALAVGIDYALFVVVRFRAALRAGRRPLDAVGETMDSAGKAVLVSGLAVLASLSAVILVPSQPFRTSVAGILLAVGFVLAASLTLLPAVLGSVGPGIDRFALPWAGSVQHRSEAFARWGRLIWRRPLLVGALAAAVLVALALPLRDLHTAMPNAGVLENSASARVGAERLQQGFGPGAPAELQVVVPSAVLDRAQATLRHTAGVAAVTAPERSGALALLGVQPVGDRTGGLIERLRARLPAGSRVGGSAAEAHDLERALDGRMPLVYALVLTVGFILLLVVVRAPLAAGAAVLLNLIATAAAFGVAKLIFQDGVGAAVLGFKSQGFVDAWAPVFFFCLSFALAMDYTVFLLTSVRAEFERTGDAREALVEGLARSGRVINAAGAVMIVVFFTFGSSHPLPPKEMGVILGVAVLLDTMLVRLLLLPAVLRLLGARAWWVPSRVDRWLPSVGLRHAEPETR
ncbi:MAG TPA: MMPL family transporter [Solirubrobacteraceae bacterium]|nr:MMPL family transporter [Solirubrobacteraceae bacterium]